MGRKAVDLTGQVFGHLTAVRLVPRDKNGAYWECRCSCARITVVRAGNLRTGRTSSCGQCNAVVTRALRGDTARWHLHIWTADKMKLPSSDVCTYGFGVLRDPQTQALATPLVKTPVLCTDVRTFPLKAAFDAGLITGMRENRPSVLRWLEEERIVLMGTTGYSSRLEVIRTWEEISGLTHPDRAWMEHAARARRNDVLTAEIGDAGKAATNEYQGLLDGWVA